MSVEKLNKLKKLLANPRKIVITTHRGPDGDAMILWVCIITNTKRASSSGDYTQ